MTANSLTKTSLVGAFAALLSVAPLLHLTRENSWLVPALVAVAAVLATGYVMRRLGVPGVLIPIAQLAVVVLWTGIVVAGDAALFGFIPTTAWATRLVDVFGQGVDVVNTYVPPVPVPEGIVLMLVGGAGAVALLVDTVAVTLRQVALAGIPLAACYTVAAAVTTGGMSWWWFVPPATGYLVLLISEGRDRVAAWGRSAASASDHSSVPETAALARNGRRVSVVALVAAVAIPGAAPVLSEGFLGPGGSGGGGDGETIRTDNPIVDLQRNLQRPENVDVLTYRSSNDEPQYIRTVALDVFNGEEWKTSNRPVPDSVEDGLPSPQGLDLAEVPTVNYNIEVTDNYSSSWLPLPYPPREIAIDGDWRYHGETLDVVSPNDDVQSANYQVSSALVEPQAEALNSAGEPGDDLDPLTEVPESVPDIVTNEAAAVTKDAQTDFERAAALQEWFRGPDGGFVYDIESQPGHSSTALRDFLTERRGYCEQFAASMALMARSLDIPARVAVGFTPGDYQGDATWLVRAHDAHAWPELYFDGVGWVRFEPTPATRSGTAPDWTYTPSQDESTEPTTSPSEPTSNPSPSEPGAPTDDDNVDDAAAGSGTTPPPWPLAILGVLLVVAFVSTPWLHARLGRAWRWRRVGADGEPVAAAEAAWADLREAVRDVGMRWEAAETPRACGQRLAIEASLGDDDQTALGRLVEATERARYAPHFVPLPTLRSDAAQLRRGLFRSVPVRARIRAFVWPSRLRDAAAEASRAGSRAAEWLEVVGERTRETLGRFTTAKSRR